MGKIVSFFLNYPFKKYITYNQSIILIFNFVSNSSIDSLNYIL